MPVLVPRARKVLVATCASLGLLVGQAVRADFISTGKTQPQQASPLLDLDAPAHKTPSADALDSASGLTAIKAISRGRWTTACNIATRVLAMQVPDVDALGVFALCAALRNDKEAANSAINRLREIEAVPGYYGLLTEGVFFLRDGLPDKAESAFNGALQSRSGSPLALYFNGEALHARHKDAEAISTFKAVLKIWPDYAPALTAAARVMAAPKASKEDLNAALAMSERAVSIEPSSVGYWRLLADLCDRTGQHDRANAIAVQWLRGPPRVQ